MGDVSGHSVTVQKQKAAPTKPQSRGVTTARGGVWTAVQVGSILRRVGHFASGRSIKQQTNNKQQAKLTPSDSAKKGGRGGACHRIEPLPGVDSRPSR